MTTLHMINRDYLLPLTIDADDAVILIANGVYQQFAGCYVLEDDLKARGLAAAPAVKVVNYTGFVELCTRYEKVVSW